MKHYKDFIIHGVQLLRHLKVGQQVPDGELAHAKLPLAVASTAARALISRQTSAAEGDDSFGSPLTLDEDESGGDFLSLFGDDPTMAALMENVEECGVDVEDMMTKAMGAFMLYGSDLSSFDPRNPDSFVTSLSPMLAALKDSDEKECSDAEMDQLTSASQDFLQCSGMADLLDLDDIQSVAMLQNIEDGCKAFFDLMLGDGTEVDYEALMSPRISPPIDVSELDDAGEACIKTFLGDGPVGNYIRYQYNHIDKELGCLADFGEALPHCVLSAPTQGGDALTLPLSLEKKLDCVIGSSYEGVLEMACGLIYTNLDECLPQIDDDSNNADVIPFSCGEEEALMGMDPSVVTGNQLPDFCANIYKGSDFDIEELQSRFDYYNKHREYGWTIATIENEVEAIPAPPVGKGESEQGENETSQVVKAVTSQESEQPKEEYKSNPSDITSIESANWADDETAPDDSSETKTTSFTFLVAGLVIAAAVGAVMFAKNRKPRSTLNNASRKEYGDLAFDVDDHEMA